MIVTLAEVEIYAKRGLAGRGAPPGIDEDAAASAAWLESRGLPALAVLLAILDGHPITLRPPEGSGSNLDAGGQSAILLGGALIDQAVASAADSLTVAQLADPIYLLPLADRRRRAGWCFSLRWGNGLGAALDRDGGIALSGETDVLAEPGPVTVVIACRRDAQTEAATSHDLARKRSRTLATGLTVDDAHWRRLGEHAASALVPASDESRVRGAGWSGSQ